MEYYVTKGSHGMLELRQSRFRSQRHTHAGEGHPHDVCAVARNREDLEGMLKTLSNPSVDWGELDAPDLGDMPRNGMA